MGTYNGRSLAGRTTHEPSQLRRLGLAVGIAIALAGCDEKPQKEYSAYWEHPTDPVALSQRMNECLDRAKGPQTTNYNDWDEAIEACQNYAEIASRYCPAPDMNDCLPQYRRRIQDVRAPHPHSENNHD